MGTRGFQGMLLNGQTRTVYNHYDSYPTGLGVQVVEFLRTQEDLAGTAEKFFALTVVDESATPEQDVLDDLKARGFWEQVSTGADWYSALRSAQGNIGAYIEAGYVPAQKADPRSEKDSWLEWGYLVDLDEKVLRVYEYGYKTGAKLVAAIPFDKLLAPGFDPLTEMSLIELAAREEV